ncbi:hypothetical protein GGS26DRAFT_598598 [Hypomontagnella submonticulosa]|nr:hypothetical protein GGS26DRAFT_598598 [Hypomontagnella submonticulosa]
MDPSALPFRPGKKQNWHQGVLSGTTPRDSKSQRLPVATDSRSKVPCRFYQSGHCRNGDSCPFLHSEKPIVEAPVESDRMVHVQPIKEVTRTLGGASVHFEAGAAVTKIETFSDFSTIQISQLPKNSSPNSVLDILQSYELKGLDANNIRVIPQQDTFSSAVIKIEDPELAKSIIYKLRPQTKGEAHTPVATLVEGTISSDSNTLRVDCKKVRCSWHKACKPVWLKFGNATIADRVCAKFRDGTYKILDQRIQCDGPKKEAGWPIRSGITVCLTNVPAAATYTNVATSIRSQSDSPRDIELGEPNYDIEPDLCSVFVKSLLTKIGPLEWWELTPDNGAKRMKASARFQNEGDAREAVRTLDDSSLPFNETAKLTMQLVYTAKFKIDARIYKFVEPLIMRNLGKWKSQNIIPKGYDALGKWYRVFKLEGDDKEKLVAAKNTMTKILEGTIAKDGSSVLWHPFLRHNGAMFQQLNIVGQMTGVLVYRRRAKSQIVLYGLPNECEKARVMICNLINNEKKEEFYIELDDQKFLWARQGGIKAIAAKIGSKYVNLDVLSMPKRIIITGNPQKYDTALATVSGEEVVQDEQENTSKPDCSVCWTEAENPIKTGCNHFYCLDCFENLCVSATEKDSPVGIRCVRNEANCNSVLGLQELQDHLSSTAFEELLEKSFTAYVRCHPQLLKYCPSPDCGYVYRATDKSRMQICPNCLVPICTRCHAQHGETTCAEYQDISSGRRAAFEKLKKEIGIKDCPKCKTPLEKTEGCNHMQCKCGAHICWVCLQTFNKGEDCYTHMSETHGGIGLEHYQHQFG